MKTTPEGVARVACVLCLISLALMAWSILDPAPVPVVVAMSVGQVFGTLGLLLYGVVVLRDFGARRIWPRLLAPQRASMRPASEGDTPPPSSAAASARDETRESAPPSSAPPSARG
jgi:hypothetical protein